MIDCPFVTVQQIPHKILNLGILKGPWDGPFVNINNIEITMSCMGLYDTPQLRQRMSDARNLDFVYYLSGMKELKFTFQLMGYELVDQNTADFSNAYKYYLFLQSITVENNPSTGVCFSAVLREFSPYISGRLLSLKEVAIYTDLAVDIMYGENKYNLDLNKIHDEKYMNKIVNNINKLGRINADFN